MISRIFLIKLLIILLMPITVSVAAVKKGSPDLPSLLLNAENDIKKWKVAEASGKADEALADAATEEEKLQAYYVKSIVEFYKGDYAKAGEFAQKVLSTATDEDREKSFVNFIARASEKSPRFSEVKSEHFIIRYAHPKDFIIADYGKDVLEKSRFEIGLDLETYPAEPVIVEIYPDLESFTLASTLPPENVETTGVVGICKFNRIMVLSPRLLPRGYPWADTLAHEYTHYLVFLKSENTVPVWLHEGIAKFQEERWREKKRDVLSPFYETILAEALKKDELVPVEKMHPSLAMLDSAREAQLAFAQAGTNISYLVERWGNEGLVNLLESMKESDDFKVALQKVTGMEFADYYASWKADLEGKGLSEKIPGVKVKGVRIRDNNEESSDGSEDLVDIDNRKARDHARLGDLLRTRGRLRSASYEYEKALGYDPGSPLISTRLASALHGSGEPDKALGILTPLLNFYPDQIQIHMILGRIYLEKENIKKAEDSYMKAISINPFDPEIHSVLASIYEKEGRTEDALRARKALNILLSEEPQHEQ
ncbi:MAG: tetratricopeptide repeat protein [Deltaproteobacteria bacterium]